MVTKRYLKEKYPLYKKFFEAARIRRTTEEKNMEQIDMIFSIAGQQSSELMVSTEKLIISLIKNIREMVLDSIEQDSGQLLGNINLPNDFLKDKKIVVTNLVQENTLIISPDVARQIEKISWERNNEL